MWEQLKSLLDWAALFGGSALIGWAILLIFAPSLLQVASSWLVAMSPAVKGISEGLVAFTKLIWSGIKDMTDNLGSILLILLVFAGALWYGTSTSTCSSNKSCKECIDNLRPDYKFVPRTPEEKARYLKERGLKDSGWLNWFN